jgi:hypothetical protein
LEVFSTPLLEDVSTNETLNESGFGDQSTGRGFRSQSIPPIVPEKIVRLK